MWVRHLNIYNDNVILQDKEKNEKAETPWRQKISVKVKNMLKPAKTTQDWDHAANKDARTLHAFVSGEGGLGWDFKSATWEVKKHTDAQKDPTAASRRFKDDLDEVKKRKDAQKQAKKTKKDT